MIYPYGRKPDRICDRLSHRIIYRGAATVLMLACFLTGVAYAQAALPLTLAETEQLALAAEPGQQALHAGAAALAARAVIAGELPDPTLRIGLNNYPLQSGGFSTEAMTNAGIGVRQAFPAGKTRSISARQFELFAGEMNANAAARGRNVLTAARTAWLDLYQWEQAHELVAASRPFFDDLVTITRSLYSVGRKSQQDVLRAELELSRLDDRLIDIERQRAQARAALSEWIGAEASRSVALQLPGWNTLPELAVLQNALLEHPSLRAADQQIDARSAGVELANERSKPGWAVDVGYSYREGTLPTGEPRSDFVSIGVSVDLPFFSRQSVDSTLTAALEERSAARMRREQTLRALQSRLVAENARWQDLTRRLALYDSRILNQARSNAEASMLSYRSDSGDFADVMRAYIDDLNTRIDHIRLQVERAQSYAVLANLGGLPL